MCRFISCNRGVCHLSERRLFPCIAVLRNGGVSCVVPDNVLRPGSLSEPNLSVRLKKN